MSLLTDEANARASRRRARIAAFREHRELSQRDMEKSGGRRYTSRLYELREEGWQIDSVNLGRGVFRYRLIAEPTVSPQQSLALEAA